MKLITVSDNGVIWLENNGQELGVVSATKIIDSDGQPFAMDAVKVLEDAGLELRS